MPVSYGFETEFESLIDLARRSKENASENLRLFKQGDPGLISYCDEYTRASKIIFKEDTLPASEKINPLIGRWAFESTFQTYELYWQVIESALGSLREKARQQGIDHPSVKWGLFLIWRDLSHHLSEEVNSFKEIMIQRALVLDQETESGGFQGITPEGLELDGVMLNSRRSKILRLIQEIWSPVEHYKNTLDPSEIVEFMDPFTSDSFLEVYLDECSSGAHRCFQTGIARSFVSLHYLLTDLIGRKGLKDTFFQKTFSEHVFEVGDEFLLAEAERAGKKARFSVEKLKNARGRFERSLWVEEKLASTLVNKHLPSEKLERVIEKKATRHNQRTRTKNTHKSVVSGHDGSVKPSIHFDSDDLKVYLAAFSKTPSVQTGTFLRFIQKLNGVILPRKNQEYLTVIEFPVWHGVVQTDQKVKLSIQLEDDLAALMDSRLLQQFLLEAYDQTGLGDFLRTHI